MNYSTLIIDGYNEIVGPTNNLPLDDIQVQHDRGRPRLERMICTRQEST